MTRTLRPSRGTEPRDPSPGVGDAVERVRAHLARGAWLAAGLGTLAALAAVLALAWWIAGPRGWSQGTPAPLALDVALGVVAAGIALWLRIATRGFGDERIARAMETSAGLEAGTVVGALQLARVVPAGVSSTLAGLAERGVAARLDHPVQELAGALGAQASRWTQRGAATLAVAAPLAALLLVAEPGRSREAWRGLARPLSLLPRPVLPPLAVGPGDAEVPRGMPLTVRVGAPGRTEVTFRWQAAGDPAHVEARATVDGAAALTFAAVDNRISYSVTAADGAASAIYTLTPIDPLLVEDVTLELSFPPHTGRAPEEYRGEAPPLTLPAGTRVRVEGSATRRLSAAALERPGGPRIALSVEGEGFTGAWQPAASGIYAWSFRDAAGGDAAEVPAPLDLTLVADSAPRIRFAHPGADTTLPIDRKQPLVLELRDDHGLRTMELHAWRVTSLGERRAPVVQSAALDGVRGALLRPTLDVSGWELLPGDTVRYFARVLDNAPIQQVGRTPEYALRVPAASELRREAQREIEAMAGRLEALARRAREAAESARDLERGARTQRDTESRARAQIGPRGASDRAAFESRESLEQAIEEQQGMSAEAEHARRQIDALDRALRDAAGSDPELREDLAELAELLATAASPELREQLQRMSADLDDVDPRQLRSTLARLTAQQEQFRRQLDASLEQLRRAAAGQDFRATAEDARELAQREEALAGALKEGDQPELRRDQQARLRLDAAELAVRMEELRERLESLAEADAQSGVEDAQREARDAERAMERTEQALGASQEPPQGARGRAVPPNRSGRSDAADAADEADRAGQALDRAADRLEAARQEMSDDRARQTRTAMARAAEQALVLARGQAALRDAMRDGGRDGLAGLEGDERAIEQGLHNLAAGLAAGGGDAPDLRAVGGGIERARAAVAGVLRSMESAVGSAAAQTAAENAVKALNALAVAALGTGEQMSQGGGSGDPNRQLERLAQRQGRLNNRAGEIAPLQLGRQAMGEQTQQLAEEQTRVAGDLQGLADRPAARERTLGDLQTLAEEARSLADRLAGGRLDAETRERQQRLFHRLLDAGRTLERDDEISNDRESRTAGAFDGTVVRPLDADALGVLEFALPPAAELMRLAPAERELVLRYFDRLNRGEAKR